MYQPVFRQFFNSGRIAEFTVCGNLHFPQPLVNPVCLRIPPVFHTILRKPDHIHKLFSDALIVIILRNPVGIPVSVGIVFILLRIQVKVPLIDLLLPYLDLLQLFFYKLLRHPCRNRLQILFFIVFPAFPHDFLKFLLLLF